MKSYQIAHTDLSVSRIAYGCMILANWDSQAPLTEDERRRAVDVVLAAVDAGITLFDHADIYAHGKSEAAFAAVWKARPHLRQQIVLQSKCGVVLPDDPQRGGPGRYDFSYENIVSAVEGSLRRLETDYLDILLLHRPDPLVEPEEVARAFDSLHHAGKVRYFGVSNHNAAQIELLRCTLDQPLVVNQLQLNLLHHHLVSEGILVNQVTGPYAHASGILDYCRLHGILVQAWAPVANGQLIDPPTNAPEYLYNVAHLIAQLAKRKETSREAIALAWLLRHPAGIQPVIGTRKPERVRASALADDVVLTRQEWYLLLMAARDATVP